MEEMKQQESEMLHSGSFKNREKMERRGIQKISNSKVLKL